MGRLFGTDGIRGVANEELTCELALSVGRAVALVLTDKNGNPPKVIVGYDTRISSKMLAGAIIAGLCSMGCDVKLIGVASTPAVAYLVSSTDADAGIMLSASHNPSEFNGIKIFSSSGFKLPDALEERIESIIFSPEKYIFTSKSRVGDVIFSQELLEKYMLHLKYEAGFNSSSLKIALDCSNGSATATAENIFSFLCKNTRVLFAEPDGYNINLKCGSTSINAMRDFVLTNGCDAGFAFDGDADRCLCIDERGEIVDGDDILAMCALDMKSRGELKNNTVVGTVMSNFGLYKFCKENDISFSQTKVGDRYVLEEMLLNDYKLGGEQSGHIIFGDCATTGDGQLTAIKVLSLMERTKLKLSELKSVIKHFPQALINVKTSADGKLSFYTDEEIGKAIESAEHELGDSGRILVRPSGTEPLIRVMTEGADQAQITEIAERIANLIKNNLK